MASSRRFWNVRAAASKVGELWIYGDIVDWEFFESDVTASRIKDELKALGEVDRLDVHINSYGGSAWQGQAIYTLLRQHPATKHVYIDGLAASIASVIAMAGDRVYIPANAMVMVHRAWTIILGNGDELRKEAELLDKLDESLIVAYMAKIGDKTPEEEVRRMIAEETWLLGQEAVDKGFADELLVEKEIAACASDEMRGRYLKAYRRMPEAAKTLLQGAGESGPPVDAPSEDDVTMNGRQVDLTAYHAFPRDKVPAAQAPEPVPAPEPDAPGVVAQPVVAVAADAQEPSGADQADEVERQRRLRLARVRARL